MKTHVNEKSTPHITALWYFGAKPYLKGRTENVSVAEFVVVQQLLGVFSCYLEECLEEKKLFCLSSELWRTYEEFAESAQIEGVVKIGKHVINYTDESFDVEISDSMRQCIKRIISEATEMARKWSD